MQHQFIMLSMVSPATLCRFVGICICVAWTGTASADLFWCERADGSVAMLEIKEKGAICDLVHKDNNPAKSQATTQNKSSTSSATKSSASSGATRLEFPSIGADEQFTRDEIRANILLEELENEVASRDDLRTYLTQNKSGLSNEAKQFYTRKLRSHLLNIKSLQQELARLE